MSTYTGNLSHSYVGIRSGELFAPLDIDHPICDENDHILGRISASNRLLIYDTLRNENCTRAAVQLSYCFECIFRLLPYGYKLYQDKKLVSMVTFHYQDMYALSGFGTCGATCRVDNSCCNEWPIVNQTPGTMQYGLTLYKNEQASKELIMSNSQIVENKQLPFLVSYLGVNGFKSVKFGTVGPLNCDQSNLFTFCMDGIDIHIGKKEHDG